MPFHKNSNDCSITNANSNGIKVQILAPLISCLHDVKFKYHCFAQDGYLQRKYPSCAKEWYLNFAMGCSGIRLFACTCVRVCVAVVTVKSWGTAYVCIYFCANTYRAILKYRLYELV